MSNTVLIDLRYVPSMSKHYLYCPYFLYLSNRRKIYIGYPQIKSLKGKIFEKKVLQAAAEEFGAEVTKIADVHDMLRKGGLLTINKKINVDFFTTAKVRLFTSTFKPDFLVVNSNNNSIDIEIKEIKNTNVAKPHHLMQVYIYKLTLKKLLSGITSKPINIRTSIIHWKKELCDYEELINITDIQEFESRFAVKNFYSETRADDKESATHSDLVKISTLSHKENSRECSDCIAMSQCDIF